ncbi:hypothetical protein [Roseivirga seohaensis]|uniref:hypothetical protein n=1 Tax=Roseivirga seohaensis TaxID=1914963 RepID=UPI003BAB14D5
MGKIVTWNAQSLNASSNVVHCKGAFRVLLMNLGEQKLFYKKQSDLQFILYVPGKSEDEKVWLEMGQDAGVPENEFAENMVIKFDGEGTREAYAKIFFLLDQEKESVKEVIPR